MVELLLEFLIIPLLLLFTICSISVMVLLCDSDRHRKIFLVTEDVLLTSEK